MDTPTSSRSLEHQQWLTQLAESRAHVLARARAGTVEMSALRRVADTEAELLLTLHSVPEDVVEQTRATHAYARPYLERLLLHNPEREVIADNEHRYTPRKVLRRVLDHALDHLNQLEQWLRWQQQGSVPSPTDGWADSATTLEEDRLPLTAADLSAWLWRIDLVVEVVAQRAEYLSLEQLDWIPPTNGWSLRQMLHHLASAELYYVVWLDAALPEETLARYDEVSRRLGEQVSQILSLPGSEQMAFFGGGELAARTIGQVIQEALAAEHVLFNG